MRTVEQTARKVISAKEVYVGIDVHKESWHVTVRSDGEERFNGRIPGQHHSLKRVLERYRDVRIKERSEMGRSRAAKVVWQARLINNFNCGL